MRTAALLIVVTALSGAAADDSPYSYHEVRLARRPPGSSCSIAAGKSDLATKMYALGWDRQSNDFPAVNWRSNVVVLVTLPNANSKPGRVYGVDSLSVTLAGSSAPSRGAFVIEVPKRLADADDCKVVASAAVNRSAASSLGEVDADYYNGNDVAGAPTNRYEPPPR